ncbi:Dihydrolipoyllysine-residue acetyltransferase component of pyruvate dehydrogenase complex [Nocardioides dokdonensis FR1436]|uniref:Dihydrolipoamide acetyltransferase component of pyruvate dehydrogenase complex n=1 Tax=Nocardioides dokdonensis FR1436 TaxID=1300347 RepID=A0A1A9GH57_9ACTN|nr:dihydrolipoamide acetyltransferase family protein [Nocardioides dokdonensis]ANH37628.1 Dihydrolipoyllysine-residue acetyltransferase component of pyruvate dehydrogenase complex [Nocardioides dokdonensis FR1436]
MRDFLLPDVGEGLAEAELLAWLVEVGDQVTEGQPIAEVSTDKVNVELPSPCDGVIGELPWRVTDVIPVGATLARIETAGQQQTEPADPAKPAQQTEPAHEPPAKPAGVPAEPGTRDRRVVAAPSTRRVAREQGIDLTRVRGSGPGGRILRADLEQPGATTSPDRAPAPAPTPAVPGQSWTELPLSGVRLTSAKRLEHSARTYATATTTFTVHGDGLLRLRSALRSEVEGEQVGMLALMLKAVSAALVRNPRFNARVDEESRTLLVGSHVDLAVAIATEHGLTVPAVRAVQEKSARRVHAEVRELSERAHAQRLTAQEMDGATFTVSSTGSLERSRMVSTTPIINPPQVATLWLSRIADAPRVGQGGLEAGPVLTGSISFDHRFIDGAEAVAMINDLTLFLEEPERALA